MLSNVSACTPGGKNGGAEPSKLEYVPNSCLNLVSSSFRIKPLCWNGTRPARAEILRIRKMFLSQNEFRSVTTVRQSPNDGTNEEPARSGILRVRKKI